MQLLLTPKLLAEGHPWFISSEVASRENVKHGFELDLFMAVGARVIVEGMRQA